MYFNLWAEKKNLWFTRSGWWLELSLFLEFVYCREVSHHWSYLGSFLLQMGHQAFQLVLSLQLRILTRSMGTAILEVSDYLNIVGDKGKSLTILVIFQFRSWRNFHLSPNLRVKQPPISFVKIIVIASMLMTPSHRFHLFQPMHLIKDQVTRKKIWMKHLWPQIPWRWVSIHIFIL